MDDLTDRFTPRSREILLRFRKGQYASLEEFLRANADITAKEAAQVTIEVMKVTGLTAEDLTEAPPAVSGKTRKRKAAAGSYQIKIALEGSRPAIWRRFVVPGEITLDKLHDVIQIVMGWADSHLHLFQIEGRAFSPESEEGWEGAKERDYRLCDLVVEAGTKFDYMYDFGDGWQHTLVVERITPVAPGQDVVPKCLAGKQHCPPEDVGGPGGYACFLTAYLDPENPEHQECHERMGDGFDPKALDVGAVNMELARLER